MRTSFDDADAIGLYQTDFTAEEIYEHEIGCGVGMFWSTYVNQPGIQKACKLFSKNLSDKKLAEGIYYTLKWYLSGAYHDFYAQALQHMLKRMEQDGREDPFWEAVEQIAGEGEPKRLFNLLNNDDWICPAMNPILDYLEDQIE